MIHSVLGQFFKACLHRGGGPQIGEVACGGSFHLSSKRDKIKMKDYMNRRVTQPKRVTSPTWGPPPPCKQALSLSWPSPVRYRNLVLKYPFQSRPFYFMQLLYGVSTLFEELLSRSSCKAVEVGWRDHRDYS